MDISVPLFDDRFAGGSSPSHSEDSLIDPSVLNDLRHKDSHRKDPYSPVGTDFFRPIYCVFGLPIDAVTLNGALEKIRVSVRFRIRCLLSTPNINFLMASQSNSEFRNSVINSDLVVADGMPLVWIGRAMGVPFRERIAGATLFERICGKTMRSMSVYFFGGPDGAAGEAAQNVNSTAIGAKCVGFNSPGFGSVDELSRAELIDHINRCHPDFLVVAMGAKKGQEWIERNFMNIKVPVVSHLGAVVNMVARRISRAPLWCQKLGMEWLWRIKEEPEIWKRYYTDGLLLVRLLLNHGVPCVLYQRFPRISKASFDGTRVEVRHEGSHCRITLSGPWKHSCLSPLRVALTEATQFPTDITVDLRGVPYLDSAAIALLILLYGHQKKRNNDIRFEGATSPVRKILKAHCVEYLLFPTVSEIY